MRYTTRRCKYPYHYDFVKMTTGNQKKTGQIGQIIKAYREKNGLSKAALARKVEAYSLKYGTRFTSQDLYNYEISGYSPKIDKLTALCEVTGISFDTFCGYNSKKTFCISPRSKAA